MKSRFLMRLTRVALTALVGICPLAAVPTQELLSNIRRSGLRVEDVFKRVRAGVI